VVNSSPWALRYLDTLSTCKSAFNAWYQAGRGVFERFALRVTDKALAMLVERKYTVGP
jgi:hypothetical protein